MPLKISREEARALGLTKKRTKKQQPLGSKGFGEPTEARFLGMVIKVAQLRGWRVAHFRPAQTATGWRTAVQGDGKGFPDLLMIREDKMIVAELKCGKNRCTTDQIKWLHDFGNCNIRNYIWRPCDWPAIEAALL